MKAEYKLKHTPKGEQMKTFFTSDTHYGHTNICRGESRWEGKRGCRDFDSVPEMNEAIVEGINSSVGQHDILYHLGDWSFGGFEVACSYSLPDRRLTIHTSRWSSVSSIRLLPVVISLFSTSFRF